MKTKNYLKILMAVLIWLPVITIAQGVAINDDDSEADPSAILDMKSTDKGVLFPRLTSDQILNIPDPASGLILFNADNNSFYFYDSINENVGFWRQIAIGTDLLDPFQCGNLLSDYRDGQTYTTVLIGTQCWMAENLNIGTMIFGGAGSSDDDIIEKYCYDTDPVNCDTYGGLYAWNEMMNWETNEGTRGLCPEGWHIPTDEEWKTLEGIVDSQYDVGDPIWNSSSGYRGFDAGKNLKSTTGWYSNGNGTNSFGFTAYPGGNRHYSYPYFSGNLISGRFWTSTRFGSNVTSRYLSYSYDGINRNINANNNQGYSVRCIKD